MIVDYMPMADMALNAITQNRKRLFRRISVSRYNSRMIKTWADAHNVSVCFIVDELMRGYLAHEPVLWYHPEVSRKYGTRCPLSVNCDRILYERFRDYTFGSVTGYILDDLIDAFLTRVGGHE